MGQQRPFFKRLMLCTLRNSGDQPLASAPDGCSGLSRPLRTSVSLAGWVIALAAMTASGRAEDPPAAPAIPPPLFKYMDREIAQTMHYAGAPWLIRESRQREEDCSTLLEALHVKPGMVICDLGCGNGFYTLKLAEMTGPTGRVLAVDIQQEMLHMLDERAKENGVKNIEPILGMLHDPKLPPDSLDLVLLVDVYHELSHPEHVLRSIRKSLKSDGRLVLAEFRLEDPNVPIKLLHKMSKKQVLKELEPNGFKLVEEYDELPWQHLMFFQRDDRPDADLPPPVDGSSEVPATQGNADPFE